MMRKKIPRQHESKSSDGESSSEIQEDSDSFQRHYMKLKQGNTIVI